MLIIKEDFKRLEREQNSAGFGNGKVQTDIIGLRKYPLELHNQDIVSHLLEHTLHQKLMAMTFQFIRPDT